MADSGSESTVEEIDELAFNSSSSCSSSSDDDGSDSDSNPPSNKSSSRTPIKTESSESTLIDKNSVADTDASFENALQYSLNAFRKIKGSRNKEEELVNFYKWYVKNVDQLTPEQAQKVKNLNIQMADIPDDRVETFEHKNMAGMYIPFSQEEIDVLSENWNCFCEDYRFDPTNDAHIFFKKPHIKKKQKRMFKHYISQYLNRRLNVVHGKFIELYSRRREERFLPEEDELLLTWNDVTVKGKGGKQAGGFLGGWKIPLFNYFGSNSPTASTYVDQQAEVPSEKHERPRNCKNDEYPDWTKNEETWKEIAKANGQFTVKELKKSYFQKLYPSAKSSTKFKPQQFKNLLIEQLSLLKDPTWENVDWKELGETCFNVGAVRVYSVVRSLTKQYVPMNQWGDLKAAVKIIKTNCSRWKERKKQSKGTGVSSEKHQGSSGELQEASQLVQISRKIRSENHEPDCEADIDDPDIMDPAVKESEGPSEHSNINGVRCSTPDSKNSESVSSLKKRNRRLEKSRVKEERDGYGNNITENDEAQEHPRESSHDDADKVASRQREVHAKLLNVEEGNVKIINKNPKGERRKRRENNAEKRKTNEWNWETGVSLSYQINGNKESLAVDRRKMKRRKKEKEKNLEFEQ